ncbi:uncharacterized protein LOC142327811 [Lycorma delicatula]|uniref:uncharacterized protein LOC142327811 n=1 Tax=Lycorma delicatula TaxID=130591 RepID=UPI003F5189F9
MSQISLFLLYLLLFNIARKTEAYICIKPNLEIVVAPEDKYLQVHWEIEKESFREGDWIGLYDGKNDLNNSSTHLIYSFDAKKETGWYTTKIKFEKSIVINFYNPVTLKYRAVYWRKNFQNGQANEAIVMTTLSTFPNWMTYYWNIISNRPINELFIPGTHDSVSDENIEVPDETVDQKGIINTIKNLKESSIQKIGNLKPIHGLAMTQDTSIIEQLVLGIRYLDIRVLYRANVNEYWTGHGLIFIQKLDDVIDQVVEFVSKTEKEIVIFHIHEFIRGITSMEDHWKLIEHLKIRFTRNGKKWWIPPQSWTSELQALIKNINGGKVIISYEKPEILKTDNYGILWSPVQHIWSNKDKISELKAYFEDIYNNGKQPKSIAHAVMAELTTQRKTKSVARRLITGMDNAAQKIAETIYHLFMREDFGVKTNILATDYFMGMGTVRQALIWNVRTSQLYSKGNTNNRICDPHNSYDDTYYQKNINESIVMTTLSTFPNWMTYYWNIISNRPINELFIPGTHDSVSDENIEVPDETVDQKGIINTIKNLKESSIQKIGNLKPIHGLAMTQDTSIIEQLVLGIRYLDIRVLYRDNVNEYWTGHGLIFIQKLDDVIDQVVEFVSKTEKEIVIFHIHEFLRGITSMEDHWKLIEYLKIRFTRNGKKWWIPPQSWTSDLQTLIQNINGGKVIISYEKPEILKTDNYGILWFPVQHIWSNKDNISELKAYFEDIYNNDKLPKNTAYAAMAVLTTQRKTKSVARRLITGTDNVAQKTAETIYHLFMREDIGAKTNILATDYFMGMGTVRQALIWNLRKSQFNSYGNRICDPRNSYDDTYYQKNINE